MNYKCLDCDAKFNEQDQTNQDHRNGICPCCGSEDIVDIDERDQSIVHLYILGIKEVA